jgi:hypothetical protein
MRDRAMKCSICESPNVAVIAHTLGDNGIVDHLLCAKCDEYCRPDSFVATPPAYVRPDSNGAFISWD